MKIITYLLSTSALSRSMLVLVWSFILPVSQNMTSSETFQWHNHHEFHMWCQNVLIDFSVELFHDLESLYEDVQNLEGLTTS